MADIFAAIYAQTWLRPAAAHNSVLDKDMPTLLDARCAMGFGGLAGLAEKATSFYVDHRHCPAGLIDITCSLYYSYCVKFSRGAIPLQQQVATHGWGLLRRTLKR